MNGRGSSGNTLNRALEAHDGPLRPQKWDLWSVATKASMCGGGGPLHGRPVEKSWAAGRILAGAARHRDGGLRRRPKGEDFMVDGHAIKVRTWGLAGTNPLLPAEFRPKPGRRMGGRRTKTRGLPETFRPAGFSKGCPCLPARKGAPSSESLDTGKVLRPWVKAHVANKPPTTLRAGKTSMENIGESRGPIAEGERNYGPFVSYFVPVSGTERLSRVGLGVIGTTTEPADMPFAQESEVGA